MKFKIVLLNVIYFALSFVNGQKETPSNREILGDIRDKFGKYYY